MSKTKPREYLAQYYHLTKPGIVYGNVLVGAAGFLYATEGPINWTLFATTMVGLSCVIASACIFNNYLDIDIDAKMARTKKRALVSGEISTDHALIFSTTLGLIGGALLLFFTTQPAFGMALLGWVIYVCAYTPLKRVTPHTLWVGAVAGATPPVVGYVAVTGSLDITCLWLFLFLFVWQIPHFLSIAYYRYDEYTSAQIPLLIPKPSRKAKKIGRWVFYASLVVLLLWCGALMLHK